MPKELWGRLVLIRLFRKNGQTIDFKAVHTHKSFAIHFNIPFGDSSSSQVCTVSIMNLSKAHRNMFQKGLKVQVFAGYEKDTGLKLISEGAILNINPFTKNDADSEFTFTFSEGQALLKAQSSAQKKNTKSEQLIKKQKLVLGKTEAKKFKVKTHTALSFAPGTNSNVIIRRVASDAGMKIEKLKLPKPKTFKKGYVAKGKPYTVIKKLANASGAQVYERRGKLLIDDLSKNEGKNEHILLTMHVKGKHGGSGLIEHVTFDDGSDSDNTVSFKSFLRNQISTGSLITIDDPPYFTGTRRVKSGEHNCDDDTFTTTGEVYFSDKN
ncbi:hypothetical protein [Apilactobacillus xinyiensis]|uniref:hypothetical protein n=1 Tax=Apilactobacillus xinyiensis TaxID=2841032 RepID=UPI00200DB484|nr:hypothetical protein [Apilactobacillus xinyiensis]MCL0330535.1 hypothetical protein [Apilactobacillus xinyiensis]